MALATTIQKINSMRKEVRLKLKCDSKLVIKKLIELGYSISKTYEATNIYYTLNGNPSLLLPEKIYRLKVYSHVESLNDLIAKKILGTYEVKINKGDTSEKKLFDEKPSLDFCFGNKFFKPAALVCYSRVRMERGFNEVTIDDEIRTKFFARDNETFEDHHFIVVEEKTNRDLFAKSRLISSFDSESFDSKIAFVKSLTINKIQ